MKTKQEIIIAALMVGQEITLPNGRIIKRVECTDGKMHTCQKMQRIEVGIAPDGTLQNVKQADDWYDANLGLDELFALCEPFKHDDLFIISSTTALIKMKQR